MAIQGQNGGRSLKPFFTLWVGQMFSLLGSQLVQFALIWWLTQETGSATVLAIASIVGLVPQVALGPFVGPLVDRWNRRHTMILADAVVALATLILALLFWSGAVEFWHIYAILFVRALGSTFHGAAMTASTSLMVPQEHLTRIQGLNQMLNGGLNIVSAPLGALLLALLPIQGILMIDLVTAAIAIVAVFIVRVPQPARAEPEREAMAQYWHDLREGLRYTFSWRGLLVLGVMAMVINLVLSPTMSFMPLLITEHFKGTAWHLSAMEAATGIGVVIGGLALSAWGGFKRRIHTSLMGVVGIGLGILLVGLTPATLFPLAVAGMALAGITMAFANGPIMAIVQAVVAPEMQGRVFTLMGATSAAMMPLGLAIAGPLADVIGVRTWFIAGGIVTLAVAVLEMFSPALMNIEQERDDHPPAVDLPLVEQVGS